MAASVGGSNIEITASSGKAESTFSKFFKTVEGQGKKLKKTFDGFSPFEKFEKESRRFDGTIGKQLRNLPEHLKPFHQSLNQSRREFRDLQKQGTQSLDALASSAIKSATSLDKMTSVTDSGKKAIKIVDRISASVKETQLAVLGLNKEGKLKISADDSAAQMKRFRSEIVHAQGELQKLRDAGDFASYNAGMIVLERKMADVDKSFAAVSRGGMAYTRMLQSLGIVTSDMANQSAIAMEAYKGRFIRSIDLMNARATQSSKMLKILPETSNIQAVDRFFLGIGDRLEKMAKQGTAANLALKSLGPNASMKDLTDRMMLINQGLMRFQQFSLVAGIALAGFTSIMANAAKGPKVADVLKAQADAMARYSEDLKKRTSEIENTWNIFENIQLKKTTGAKLTANLQEQVNALKNWRANLAKIAQGAGTEFANYLSNLGPQAAGEVAALSKMSAPGLDKYVALWKEKHALARKQAESELVQLRAATQREIARLQASLQPLGISIENLQKTWAKASGPFIQTWGWVASKVVDAATALGEFINKLNQINPQISAAAGMFMYLATALSLILAPMAIGIGKAKGMQAALSFIMTTLTPVITGFLRIAGITSVVAGVLVALGLVFYNLWKNSENFRTAISNLWINLKNAVGTAIQPLIKAFKTIAAEFVALINNMVGSKGQSMTSFWKTAGDQIAVAINKISAVIKALTPVFTFIFGIIANVVVTTFHNIVAIIKSGIAIIVNIFGLFKNLATGNFSGAWGNIKAIFTNAIIFIWNYIQLMFVGKLLGVFRGFAGSGLTILKSGWAGIKTAAISVFTSIKNFILSIFTGINSGTVAITTRLYNGVLSIFRGIFTGARFIFTSIYNFLKFIFTSIHQWISGRTQLTFRFVSQIWNSIFSVTRSIFSSVWNFIRSLFTNIFNFYVNILRRIYLTFANGWASIRASTVSVFQSIWNFFRSIFGTIAGFLSRSTAGIRSSITNAWQSIKNNTSSIFSSIWTNISGMFTKIVSGARGLPKRIGDGIKSMAGYAVAGAIELSNRVARELAKGVNSVTGGINWVLGKVGVKKKIPTWNPPQYEKGTGFHPGGMAIVGEKGRELAYVPGVGVTMVGAAGSELINLPKGSSVLPNDDTEKLLSRFYPGYASGIGDFFKKALDKSVDIFNYLSNPKDLLKKIWDKIGIPKIEIPGLIGDIASGGISKIKDSAVGFVKSKMSDLSSLFGGSAPNISGGAKAWQSVIVAAAQKMGESVTAREIQGIIAQIQRESHGNQRIVQSNKVVDVNTLSGNPARGLLQYIPQTFRSYAVKGHNNIYSGLDQLLAFFNNRTWRRDLPYGKRGWGPRGARKFAKGGFFLDGPQMGLFGDGGPEMALPLIGKNMLPFAVAMAENFKNLFGGEFMQGGGEIHNHYWNVNADEINEVQKLVTMVGGLRKQTRKGG